MKDHRGSSVPANVLFVLFVITLVTISCTRVKELVQPNSQSDQVNDFNYRIPSRTKNAHPDDRVPKNLPRLVILIAGQGRIHLGDLESQPIDLQTLSESIRSFAAGKTEYEKAVYIAARSDIDATTVLKDVLNVLRKHEINVVNLLLSSHVEKYPEASGLYDRSMGDIPEPDHVLEVGIRTKFFGDGSRPNPLALVVRLGLERRLDLNSEIFDDKDELSSELAEVFDAREANGVFRENTNEIEKTVLFQIDYGVGEPKAVHKYGDLIQVIDALKEAGSSPIVLTDAETFYEMTAHSRESTIITEPLSREPKKVPTSISGGVLNGKATSLPKPPYPPAARAVRASGAVNVQVTVDENGSVVNAKAVSGHLLLRASAEQAARSARFGPTMISGQRVKVTGVLTYNFAEPP